MSADRFADMTSILNFGLGSQNRLADLNKLVAERVGHKEFGQVQELFKELLEVSGEVDDNKLAQKERQLQELQSEFAEIRIEMIKEAKLLQALRVTNEIYVARLDEEIREANDYLTDLKTANLHDKKARADVLHKRIQELHTTKAVGDSFSQQMKLTEDSLNAMSDRIWNVLMHIMPLLRGRCMVDNSRGMLAETRKLIMECARDCAK